MEGVSLARHCGISDAGPCLAPRPVQVRYEFPDECHARGGHAHVTCLNASTSFRDMPCCPIAWREMIRFASPRMTCNSATLCAARAWLTRDHAHGVKAACITPSFHCPSDYGSSLHLAILQGIGLFSYLQENCSCSLSAAWIFDWFKVIAIAPMIVCRMFTIRLTKIAATLL